jgi:hypothetical protein
VADDPDGGVDVDAIIDECLRASDGWAELLSVKEDSLFPVSMGDIEAVGDRDGRLRSLWLHPAVMQYSAGELQSRLNLMIQALRDKAMEVFDPNELLYPLEQH